MVEHYIVRLELFRFRLGDRDQIILEAEEEE